jgi:DDE superfamily endonuclease
LGAIERELPAGKLIHVILDNDGSHKHPKVIAWLARHPRWTFHSTPTRASWLNAVETLFSAPSAAAPSARPSICKPQSTATSATTTTTRSPSAGPSPPIPSSTNSIPEPSVWVSALQMAAG